MQYGTACIHVRSMLHHSYYRFQHHGDQSQPRSGEQVKRLLHQEEEELLLEEDTITPRGGQISRSAGTSVYSVMYSHGQQFIRGSPIVVLAEERKCLCLCDMPEFGWRWGNSHRMTRQEAQREPTKKKTDPASFIAPSTEIWNLSCAPLTRSDRHIHREDKIKIKKKKITCPFCIPRPFFVFLWDACVDLLVRMLTPTYLLIQTRLCGRKTQSGPL